jgi:hypothetical protein
VDADADGVGVHVAVSYDEHGVQLHLFGRGDLRFDVVVAWVQFGTDAAGAEFLLEGGSVVD